MKKKQSPQKPPQKSQPKPQPKPQSKKRIANNLYCIPFIFNVQPLEKKAFDECAKMAGLSRSAWARAQLRAGAATAYMQAGKKIPFPEQFIDVPLPLGDETWPDGVYQ